MSDGLCPTGTDKVIRHAHFHKFTVTVDEFSECTGTPIANCVVRKVKLDQVGMIQEMTDEHTTFIAIDATPEIYWRLKQLVNDKNRDKDIVREWNNIWKNGTETELRNINSKF